MITMLSRNYNTTFLSTLSLRRATRQLIIIIMLESISIHALLAESDDYTIKFDGTVDISIHALLAESDVIVSVTEPSVLDFYPRSPCGERQGIICIIVFIQNISIHALLAESDVGRGTY